MNDDSRNLIRETIWSLCMFGNSDLGLGVRGERVGEHDGNGKGGWISAVTPGAKCSEAS